MNQSQIIAVLRHIFSVLGGFAVARGWFSNDQLITALGLIPGIVAAYYAFKSASDSAQQRAVIAQSDISTIAKNDGTIITSSTQVQK